MNKRLQGSQYEQKAAAFLEKNGVQILQQNFRCKIGEIDLVGRAGNTLIFFEVKHRSLERSGFAQSAVDMKKQQIISRVSDLYRVMHHLSDDTNIRFDVVAVNGEKVTWIPNAFFYIGAF